MYMSGPNGEEKQMATSTGYCFSDASSSGNQNIQTHLLQSFEQTPEIYNLTAGMDIIGFPSKNLHQQNTDHHQNSALWKGFFTKHGNHNHHDSSASAGGGGGGGPSSSKEINELTSNHEFYQHDLTGISDTTNETMMVSSDSYHHHHHHHQNRSLVHVDDPSMRVAVFPCEGNERPSQGLSLSLSSSNPSSIGLQSFELRQQQQHDHRDNDHLIRFGPSSSSRSSSHVMMNIQQMQIQNSRYLGPAQELLNEFCNLGTKQQIDKNLKMKLHKNSNTDQWQDENAIKKQSLYSLDILELQRRKTKLLQMLEEVDRRYKHYCDQMKSVVSSFESVAGNGAATVYSALASRAMSRHFRCLRDGIVNQIKETKKAMGEKDSAAPGTVKGETPRLRLLDQTLRQQKALQQMSMMEAHPWRPQRGLPERSVSVLRAWLFEHFLHPYPSDVDKHILARQTGLSRSQVSNWFINARVRLWKPMVEEMYLEELKEKENMAGGSLDGRDENDHGLQINHNRPLNEDQKPTHDQLVRIDSECLSSIINNPEKNPKKSKSIQHNEQQNHSFGRVGGDSYGAMELDFSSYSQGGGAATIYGGGGGGGGGGVSLTLGLHQHGGNGGVSLAFSPSSQQSSLFYPRSEMEDCQTVQYSLLDSETQNLPYRNLMGAQLLHDLAG